MREVGYLTECLQTLNYTQTMHRLGRRLYKTRKPTAAAVIVGGLAAAYGGWRALKRSRLKRLNRNIHPEQSIVIVGAGFAGTYAARCLGRLLPRELNLRTTLIDERNYLLFTPMLSEVASGELDPQHIVAQPHTISPRVEFLQAVVEEIDLRRKRLKLSLGADSRILTADYIVIAAGSVTNFHHVPGVKERAFTMKSLEDANRLRRHAIEMLELAHAEPDPEKRRALLTFVVAGGGFTGVETIAALNGLVRDMAHRYYGIAEAEIQMHLVEPGSRLLPELGAGLAEYARREVEARGVKVHTNTRLTAAVDDFVEFEGHPRLPARTLIWTAGVKSAPMVEKLDCRRGRHGGIFVDDCCALPDYPGIWAIGDCAEVPGPEGGTYAPTAQNATREGERVARNIFAVMRGEKQTPFRHRPAGELALVGKRAGVAEVYGMRFSGMMAWALWRLIYLAKMPAWAQRARTLSDWILDFVFGREIAAISIDDRTRSGEIARVPVTER